MNETEDTTLSGQMASLLSNEWLQSQANELGVVQRQRLLHITDFVWVLMMVFGTGQATTLASLRSAFNLHTGLGLAQSSFNQRFTSSMASLMAACVSKLLNHAHDDLPRFESKWLEHFSNITAIDSSIIRVHDCLRQVWPSTAPGQAALKLHAVYNVTHSMPHKFKLTAGTVHDGTPWRKVGQWVSKRLFLVDLGYYDFKFLARLQKHKALFVTRAKSNFNPVILKVHSKHRGRAMDLEGKTLAEVLPRLKRQVLDVQVEVSYPSGKQKKSSRNQTLSMRLVLVFNEETGKYHRYLCNLDPTEQDALAVAGLYKLRWEIELLFKALKSDGGGLGKIPGKRACVVETLLWASIARLLLSRIFLRKVRKTRGSLERVIPERRWDKRLSEAAHHILNVLVPRRRKPSADPLLDFLLRCAPDPNADRRSLLDPLTIC